MNKILNKIESIINYHTCDIIGAIHDAADDESKREIIWTSDIDYDKMIFYVHIYSDVDCDNFLEDFKGNYVIMDMINRFHPRFDPDVCEVCRNLTYNFTVDFRLDDQGISYLSDEELIKMFNNLKHMDEKIADKYDLYEPSIDFKDHEVFIPNHIYFLNINKERLSVIARFIRFRDNDKYTLSFRILSIISYDEDYYCPEDVDKVGSIINCYSMDDMLCD